MKIKNLLFTIPLLLCLAANAQLNQRYDNINYRALYFSDASKLINSTPGLLLLDVRSPGEYADTSGSIALNIGRLKGSVNISIDSIEKHLKDLAPYKNKPILVYCSHSQRSRMVSKFLSDSGFKYVNSLNGGMSLVNKSTNEEFTLKSKLYITNLPYKLIESDDAYKFIQDKNNLIIDVRRINEFNGTDTIENNNIGRIRNAINAPLSNIDQQITLLAKFKSRPILLYSLYSQEGVEAALKFCKAGYKKVRVLFEGLSTFLPNTPTSGNLRERLFVHTPKYKAIGSKEVIDLVNTQPGIVIADLRPKVEFENKCDQTYKNLGHVVNATNFTAPELVTYLKNRPKLTPILVYGSNMPGMMHDVGAAETCKQLAEKGFTNVYLIYNGLYSLVWSVTNVENCKNGMALLENHKGLY
jgi:rhodanese-related sulfurtransferase